MAKEMLDTIRRAEAEAVNRQTMARNSVQTAVARAKADAQKAVEQAVSAAHKQVADTEQKTREDCAARSAQRSAAAQQECEKLVAAADKNRDRVIGLVINGIVGK